MNSQDEHYQEVVKRFSKEFKEDFNALDPLVYNVVNAIISGESPYKCLEDLLRAYKSLSNEFTELKIKGPQPNYLVITEDHMKELKQKLINSFTYGVKFENDTE